MRKAVTRMVLGSAALLTLARVLPATTFSLTGMGLLLVIFVEMRRRRRLAPLPV